MTYNPKNPKIGDIVYRACAPKEYGKIIKIGEIPNFQEVQEKLPPHIQVEPTAQQAQETYPLERLITIQKPEGKTYQSRAKGLLCFHELVEAHEKKSKKLRAQLTALNTWR